MKTPSFAGTGSATSISRSSAGVFVLAAGGGVAETPGLRHLEPRHGLVVLEQLDHTRKPFAGGRVAVLVEAQIRELPVAARDEARGRKRILVNPELGAGEVVGLRAEEDRHLIAKAIEAVGGGEVGAGGFRQAAQHLF